MVNLASSSFESAEARDHMRGSCLSQSIRDLITSCLILCSAVLKSSFAESLGACHLDRLGLQTLGKRRIERDSNERAQLHAPMIQMITNIDSTHHLAQKKSKQEGVIVHTVVVIISETRLTDCQRCRRSTR